MASAPLLYSDHIPDNRPGQILIMHLPKFFIVADRGELKLFRLAHDGGRPSHYRLEDSFLVEEAHQNYRERFTDQAGSFSTPSSQGHGGGIGEHHALAAETDRRIFRQLAGHIDTWLGQHNAPAWAFAAPASINGALLKKIDPRHMAHLLQNLTEDLIHLPGDKLISHLEAVTTSDIS